MYQEDQDQISSATYISDVVFQKTNLALTVEGDMVVLNVVDDEEHALVTAEHW